MFTPTRQPPGPLPPQSPPCQRVVVEVLAFHPDRGSEFTSAVCVAVCDRAGGAAFLGYLILVADALHNLIGGLAIGAAFVTDTRLGVVTWLVAAAHEVPQELGDFGILVHSGWTRRAALAYNLASAATVLVGAVAAYVLAAQIQVAVLLAFAAGNFPVHRPGRSGPRAHHQPRPL